MFDWIKKDTPPAAIIMENVTGILRVARRGAFATPFDFLMNDRRYGLTRLKDRYWVVPSPIVLRSRTVGLPMERKRVFIYLVRKDLVPQSPAPGIVSAAEAVRANGIDAQPLECYVDPDDSQKVVRSKKERSGMSELNLVQTKKVRNILGLPRRSAEGGRPATLNPAQWGILESELTPRELDVLDVAILWSRKGGDGLVHEELLVDLSQTVSRMPWRQDGICGSLHRGSKLWYRNELLGNNTLMNIMGWPRNTFVVPYSVGEGTVRRMIGNMVATPVAGVACMLLLQQVNVFE